MEIRTEAELHQQNADTYREEGSDAWKLKGTTRAAEARELTDNIIATLFNAISSIQPVPDGAEWVTIPAISLAPPVAPATDWTVNISAGEALWDGVPVPYAAKSFTVSLPGDPFQRVDSAFADRQGNIGYVSGRVGLVGIDPPIPVGTMPVGNTYWKSTGGSTDNSESFDFSQYAAYTAAPADADISAWQIADGTKRKLAWSQLKTWLGGGSVDTVNTLAPDAGTKNITLTSSHIDNAVNDATWWGTASLKVKGAIDYLANKVKANEAAILLRVKQIKQGSTTYSPDANGLVTLPELETGSTITVDAAMSTTSTNPVQNKVITERINAMQLQYGQEKAVLVPFNGLLTFDSNKVMVLGTGGSAFTSNQSISFNSLGNHINDTYITIIVTGNGANSVQVAPDFRNENYGYFNSAAGVLNVLRFHRITASVMTYTITQPA